MSDQPTNREEYLARFHRNIETSGYGLEVTQHYPCPFCGAKDWLVAKVIDTEEVLGKGAVCKECGRGAKAIYERVNGGLRFEFVQTEGADQPVWLEPKMRRIDR